MSTQKIILHRTLQKRGFVLYYIHTNSRPVRADAKMEDKPLIVALEEAKRRLLEIEDTVHDLKNAIR